jgi:hypothetical protein
MALVHLQLPAVVKHLFRRILAGELLFSSIIVTTNTRLYRKTPSR